jgi:hypothetical protein
VTEEAHENTPPAHESENQGAGQIWDENDNEGKKNRKNIFNGYSDVLKLYKSCFIVFPIKVIFGT